MADQRCGWARYLSWTYEKRGRVVDGSGEVADT